MNSWHSQCFSISEISGHYNHRYSIILSAVCLVHCAQLLFFFNYLRSVSRTLLLILLSQYISAISVMNAKTIPPKRTIYTPSILFRSICFWAKTEVKESRRQCLLKAGTFINNNRVQSPPLVNKVQLRWNCISYHGSYPHIKL